MPETLELYVKRTSNCLQGLPLIQVTLLSPTWTGETLMLVMGDPADGVVREVVGWTDVSMGSPCPVHVARVQWGKDNGYLIWGGNSGLRVLDDEQEPKEWEAHLPPGYGRPIFWVHMGNEEDLPKAVREVVSNARVTDLSE